MPPALLITAADPELPGMLRFPFPSAVFATPQEVRSIITVKPGSLVIVLDAADAPLVSGLVRRDVRAVALLTPRTVPMVFRRPIIAVVERPLLAARLVLAIRLAMAELAPPTTP